MTGGEKAVRPQEKEVGGEESPSGNGLRSQPQTSFSVYDSLQSAPRTGRLRRLPGVVWGCVRLVWRAAPRAFVVSSALQAVTSIGVAVQLLIGKQLLTGLIAADQRGGEVGSVAPELAILVVVSMALSIGGTVQAEQQRILAELVSRHVDDRLLDVAVAVDLEAFETPAFLDRLQRAHVAGQTRPWPMTLGLLSLVGSAVAVAGITVALLTIQPLLLSLVLVSSVPLWLAAVRNSRAAHAFAFGMTATDRERRYVANVLMGRDFAKEIRVFDLGGFFRAIHHRLYDRRIAELRTLVRKRLRRSVAATLVSSVLVAITMAILVSFFLSGRMTLAAVVVTALAVQQLAVRLRAIYSSAGSLYEGALFVEDFNSFLAMGTAVSERPRRSSDAPDGFSTLTLDRVRSRTPARTGSFSTTSRSRSRPARSSRSWVRTGRARRPWRNCCAACTSRRAGASCGTGSTRRCVIAGSSDDGWRASSRTLPSIT